MDRLRALSYTAGTKYDAIVVEASPSGGACIALLHGWGCPG
ncbi:MAG TPA: hypothetical protein VMX96_11195 [Dehalococcoidia bacterium]|nr:hypothetical protein [Dehalococcoidia bacterium]